MPIPGSVVLRTTLKTKTIFVFIISMDAKQPKKKLAKSKFFKKTTTTISEDDSDTSTTEEFQMEEDPQPEMGDDLKEALFRQEVRDWLSLNGKALFGLESSKFLTKQHKLKQHAVRPTMSRDGRMVTPLSIRDTGA